MKAKKILALLLAVAMLCTIFVGCDQQTATSSSGTSSASEDASVSSDAGDSSAASEPETEPTGTGDNEMVVRISAEPPKMNSLTMTDTISFSLTRHIMENLVMMDENNEIIPGCAESWELSEDGLTYTFKIREGMTWTNGEPVTANDFVFAWTKLLEPETASEYAYFAFILENGEAFNAGEASAEDVGVKAIDDYTLEVKLAAPTAYALNMFAFGSLAPVNQKFFDEVGLQAYATDTSPEYNFCTNGPFTVESWAHDSEFVIVRNEDYWNADAINLNKITFTVIADSNAALNAFEAGEVDMTELTGEQLAIAEDAGYEIINYNDGASFYIQMNTTQPGLNNVKVRTAIANSINKQAFIDSIVKNESSPAIGFVPEGLAGLKDDFQAEIAEKNGGPLLSAEIDPNAKALLEEGLAEENLTAEEFAKSCTIISDDTDSAVKYASFIQEQLRVNLGLEVQVESMPFKSRLERSQNMDFSFLFGGWGPDYNDPNTFLDLWVTDGGNNHTGYANPDYDKLIKDAAAEADLEARMEMMYEAEKIVCTDFPVAPVYWRKRDYTVKDGISGVVRTALQDINLRYVTFS